MLQTQWLVLVAIAGASSGAWLFRPTERVIPTSLAATLSWAAAAILGGGVEVISQDGSTVSASVPDEVRFLLLAFSLLSAMALLLYVAGVYPPETEETAMRDREVTQQ